MSKSNGTNGARVAASKRGNASISGTGQVVVVFQGGGALGAYQAGVYQALHEAGVEPDWVIGTSIGAINAALICGNAPAERLPALEEFWRRMTHRPTFGSTWGAWQALHQMTSYWEILSGGLRGFFEPNHAAFLGPHVHLGSDRAGYYSTGPLERTLGDLLDTKRINSATPRLTVGAAHVRTSRMRYFDSRDTEIGIRHIMASGALPPAFPAVRIDGDLYWDGGILSNTPSEIIFDDIPRRNSLIFAVHLWNPMGAEPETMWEVMHRQKDIQYSSRVATHISRQLQMHRLRHVITELSGYIPSEIRGSAAVKELSSYGCPTQMHIVRLLAPSLDFSDHTKDVDFSASGIRRRWQCGYENTQRALTRAPWRGDFDPLEGVILHEPAEDEPVGGYVMTSERVAS
jgi:NTE family protein